MTSPYLPAGISKLPWSTRSYPDDYPDLVTPADVTVGLSIATERDAAFIAHAVNSHRELCEALERVVNTKHFCGCDEETVCSYCAAKDLLAAQVDFAAKGGE